MTAYSDIPPRSTAPLLIYIASIRCASDHRSQAFFETAPARAQRHNTVIAAHSRCEQTCTAAIAS
ncbi:unnamed protein product [Ceratitis capitata]|uniref:(Mediterranean fruit fly) hypothetical protein n=1 Tax=Ceratitis capitata TaxID=7213 RepID=A0A811UA23_CERCA|nr:unnamed protein product [Ceratitis capitata]